jgi:hypothetical protein
MFGVSSGLLRLGRELLPPFRDNRKEDFFSK